MNLRMCVLSNCSFKFYIIRDHCYIFSQIVGFHERDGMPNLLNGNLHSSNDNANLILDTGIDKHISPDVLEYDYSKPLNQDEISLFADVEQDIEEDTLEDVNVTDCGKCDFIKEENRYAQSYFEKEYGELYCCNEKCTNKSKTMREFIDTRSDKCFWVCKNCKRRENDTHGCTNMFCNTCYFSKDPPKNSGRNKRARRTRCV